LKLPKAEEPESTKIVDLNGSYVSTVHGDLEMCMEGGKKVGKGGYIEVIDHRSSPRDWISMDELHCRAKTCSDVKNLRAGHNLYHGFNKVICGS
jgi:hypothetical protein